MSLLKNPQLVKMWNIFFYS